MTLRTEILAPIYIVFLVKKLIFFDESPARKNVKNLLTKHHIMTPAMYAVTIGRRRTGKQRIRELNIVSCVVLTSGDMIKATPADSITGVYPNPPL